MTIKKTYPIIGMHCASCAKLIEKKLVKSSLIKNASVNYGNETAYVESIKNADQVVQNIVLGLGYRVGQNSDEQKAKDQKILKYKIIISGAVSLLVGIFPQEFYWASIVIQLTVGLNFYKAFLSDFKNLTFGMDSLVAIGTTAAIIGGYYETATTIITLILLGRYLETSVKLKSTNAIKKLVGLQKSLDSSLMVGDLVKVVPGQIIATDGVIIDGESYIDQSMITGEAIPVKKEMGDKVIGGTINKNGSFTFKVTTIGSETVLSQIVKMVSEALGSRAEVQKLVDKVTMYFVPIVFLAAVITFFIFGLPNAIAVLLIACPCAMGLATPTAIVAAVGYGAKHGILIKDVQALEILNKVSTFVFDKTGTITIGRPVLVNLIDKRYLQIAASLESNSDHPVAKAIVQAAIDKKIKMLKVYKFNNIEGIGVTGIINSKKYFLGRSENGSIELVTDNKTLSKFEVSDKIKDGVSEVISELQNRKINTWMISGDNHNAANLIAKKAGIANVLSGVMPKEKLEKLISLQKDGQVAFVGDGINDTPALAKADVGIAMGSGSDIAIESAGIILLNKKFNSLLTVLKLSHQTVNIIYQNLFWAFFYNVVLIPVAALGYLNPMLAAGAMSFSSISVVLNSLRLSKMKN